MNDEDSMLIANLKYELKESDYIIIKIAEAVANGDLEEADRIKYNHAADLQKRRQLRQLINAIKAKWENK